MSQESDSSTPKLSLPVQVSVLLIPLPVLVYLGNPAFALLLGAALSLSINAKVIPSSEILGKYALQTAIVLLGLRG